MSSNKGFTLIEMLFVLMVICILSTLTMNLHLPQKSDDVMINEISFIINQAKTNAMIYKESVTLEFTNNNLLVTSNHFNDNYTLPENASFEEYSFTYNEFGNIKTAKKISFCVNKNEYFFVFQVGSGSFYVK